jgi:hypothetical protein
VGQRTEKRWIFFERKTALFLHLRIIRGVFPDRQSRITGFKKGGDKQKKENAERSPKPF